MIELNLFGLNTSMMNIMRLAEALAQAEISNQKFSLRNSTHCRASCQLICETAESLTMPVTAAVADRMIKCLEEFGTEPMLATEYAAKALRNAADELFDVFRKESSARIVAAVKPQHETYFLQKEPLFGEAVSLKFAKVATDISEAGKCLALGRPTACVFHLMRVVEHAVQKLGKKLRVTIDVEREGWYQITIHINRAVDILPSGNARQRKIKQEYGAAAAHLNSVRIATRNDVMHPKATYTDEEAQTLFDATKALMQQMAKIV